MMYDLTLGPGPDPTAVPDIFSSSSVEPSNIFSVSAEQGVFPTSTEPGLFSSNTPASTISVFGVSETQHNGSPGWASHGWGGRASPAVSTNWNTPTTTQVARTPPMWTPQWGNTDTNNSNTGWPDSNQKQLGAPASSHSTNPFGTSPSNPPVNQFYSPGKSNPRSQPPPHNSHFYVMHLPCYAFLSLLTISLPSTLRHPDKEKLTR